MHLKSACIYNIYALPCSEELQHCLVAGKFDGASVAALNAKTKVVVGIGGWMIGTVGE